MSNAQPARVGAPEKSAQSWRARARALRADRDLVVGALMREHGGALSWWLLLLGPIVSLDAWVGVSWLSGLCGVLAGLLATAPRDRGPWWRLSWRGAAVAVVVAACARYAAMRDTPIGHQIYAALEYRPWQLGAAAAAHSALLSGTAAIATLFVRDAWHSAPRWLGFASLVGLVAHTPGIASFRADVLSGALIGLVVLLLVARSPRVRMGAALAAYAIVALWPIVSAVLPTGHPHIRVNVGGGVGMAAVLALIWEVAWHRFDPRVTGDAGAAADRIAAHTARHPWRSAVRAVVIVVLVFIVARGFRIGVPLLVVLLLAAECQRAAGLASLFDRAAAVIAPLVLLSVASLALWLVRGRGGLDVQGLSGVIAFILWPLFSGLLVVRHGATLDRPRTTRLLVVLTAITCGLAVGWPRAEWTVLAAAMLGAPLFHAAVLAPVPTARVFQIATRGWLVSAAIATAVVLVVAGLRYGRDGGLFAYSLGDTRVWDVLVFVLARIWMLPGLWFAGALLVDLARRHRWRTVIPPDHEMFQWQALRKREAGVSAAS